MNLFEAPSIHSLRLLDIHDDQVASRLEKYGIFSGTFITKADTALKGCETIKIHSDKGNIVLPVKAAYHIHVVTDKEKGKDFHLAELREGETATITTIEKEQHAIYKYEELGLAENMEITLQRKLPHMEYRVLIDSKRRLRITESVAAAILGLIDGQTRQFFFAKRNKPFQITGIVQEEALCEFLMKNGIAPGKVIVLETIERGVNIAIDKQEDVVFYAMNGARLSVSDATAKAIRVQEI